MASPESSPEHGINLPKQQEHLIERKSPQVLVRLMAREAILTYFNTRLFVFSEPYEDMNHIYVKDPQQEIDHTYLFHSDQLLDQLTDEGFTTVSARYPEDVDIEVYLTYQSGKIDKERRELEAQDE